MYGAETKRQAGLDKAALEQFAARGGGIVALHGAVAAGEPSW